MKFLLDHDVPEDLNYLLKQLGHAVTLLSQELTQNAPDEDVLNFADASGGVLVTCNRDDFLQLAAQEPHHGIIVVIRRRTQAAERAALFRLLERAGESGIRNNVNFA